MEAKKLYKQQLKTVMGSLRELPQKNPLAVEISKAIKIVGKEVESLEDALTPIKEEFLLRDENGDYVIKSDVMELIKQASEQGVQLIPEWSGFVVDGDEDRAQEYFKKGIALMQEEITLSLPRINVHSKQIKVGDIKERLIDVLSDFFEVNQIIFLESLGILEGLDD